MAILKLLLPVAFRVPCADMPFDVVSAQAVASLFTAMPASVQGMEFPTWPHTDATQVPMV